MRSERQRVHRGLRVWLFFAEWSSRNGPLASISPWIGTVVASWLASNREIGVIIAAAVVAGLGCLPVAAAGYWQNRERADENRRDARERRISDHVTRTMLPTLAATSRLRRRARIRQLGSILEPTAQFLWGEVFEKSPDVRVVIYALKDDASGLTAVGHGGQRSAAGEIDFSTPRGAKIFDELVGPDLHVYESGVVGESYVSYVALPLTVESDVYGMLSIDSRSAVELSSDDGFALEPIAGALSVMFSEAARGARSR